MLFGNGDRGKRKLLEVSAENPIVEKGEETAAEERRNPLSLMAKYNRSNNSDDDALEEAIELVRRHLIH